MTEPDPAPTIPSPGAERLLRALVHETGQAGHQGRRRALSAARKAWLTRADPAVEHPICGTTLRLPLSHQLPVHQAAHPDYSLNLGRIAAAATAGRPDATIIDIGANVGDSVAIMRPGTTAPILCIEGDASFLPYLEVNAHRFADIEIAPTYVRTADAGDGAMAVVRDGGTARLEQVGDVGTAGPGPHLEVTPLADILAAHPRFMSPRLIKVDTDGQDAGILADADDVLASAHPVLFFEFDPAMTRAASGGDPLTTFTQLADLGYRRALFFTNLGELVIGLDRDSWREIPTLADYPSAGDPVAYFDVCAFGTDDGDLAAEVEATELARRRRRRTGQDVAAR